ncbi:MAG: ParA family protein [Lyngbya sp. HA4199-MV5]|jgi:chromosome partitioning protein|nr:ParA family protein [Lyngbya sp. HA4199-MV5]
MLVTCTSAKGGVGKTTSSIHIAALLASSNPTLLIDGDPNHSALRWSKRGNLPFQVVDLMSAAKHTRNFEHIVFDTPARPNQEDLEALVDGCDLLIIPTTPDILSIDATLETVDLLETLKCDRYRILLTIVPAGRKTGEQTRDALAELPLFKQSIRQYAAYEKAALAGLLVYEVKDRNARIAWSDYQRLGKEILP